MLRWRGDFGDYFAAWFPANFCEEINVMIEPDQAGEEVCVIKIIFITVEYCSECL